MTQPPNTATIKMQQSAKGVLDSMQGEISCRVDVVLRLLKGIAAYRYYSDLSISMFDRVTKADFYRESYDLYMEALLTHAVQTAQATIVQTVQYLGICKAVLNGFFSSFVDEFPTSVFVKR